MKIESIPITDQNKLFFQLDSRMSQLRQRNVNYVVVAHAKTAASITLTISGRQGSVQKHLLLYYNEILSNWELYYSNGNKSKKVLLDSFNDISTIMKRIVTSTRTIISKT